MNEYALKTGLWAARLLILSLIIWIVSFFGIAFTSPLFIWTNLQDYLTFVQTNSQVFQNTAKLFMFLFAPIYLLLINSFYDYATEKKKPLARLSLLFATAFTITSCIHYFVQLSVVRLNIEQGYTNGLEHFVQANPLSIMTAIDMLGWTFFFGLSSLFIFPIFTGDKLNRVIRYSFVVNGIFCMLAAIGYLFQIDVLTFLCVNLGLGGAVVVIAISSMRLFGKLVKVC